MRRKARVDDNQKEVVQQLRSIPGLKVAITSSLGGGFPDFIVGYRGVNYMVELKDGSKPPSKRRLTDKERKFHKAWDGYGQIAVCNSFEDVCRVVGIAIYDPDEIPF